MPVTPLVGRPMILVARLIHQLGESGTGQPV